jgi:menaquinone-specific isochorismate synthase
MNPAPFVPVNQTSSTSEENNAFQAACSHLLSIIGKVRFPLRRMVRLEVDIPPVCPLDWLASQQGISRYYWSDRQRLEEMAGIGEAHIISPDESADISSAFDQIRDSLPEEQCAARYYGGFRFFPNSQKDSRWKEFKAYRFIAPLIELFREQEKYHLACTLKNESDTHTAIHLLSQMQLPRPVGKLPMPKFDDRTDLPTHSGWNDLVREALTAFKHTSLEKVVLARKTTFHASELIDPILLMQSLSRGASNTYLFCFQPSEERAFLGASPERLYRRENRRIFSEALAGTRPRGKTPLEDKRFEKNLRTTEKEFREHKIVVEAILAILKEFCAEYEAAPAPKVLKLAHCQHLLTPIWGLLKAEVQDHILLNALHPTPAVGGKPTETALKWIIENEPFERGVYAAPVGCVGMDGADFCVGIRSGLALGDSLTLYAGAGIVPGSDPDEEWRELDAKMAQFMKVIFKEI